MGLFSFLRSARITSTEAKTLLSSGAILLDVRSRDEFECGHLEHAINIPVQELPSRLAELPSKSRKVVVYCRSGGRSKMAQLLLERAGYEAHDLGAMTNYTR